MNGLQNLAPTGNDSLTAVTPAHSKCFGPSSAHTWIPCPFSAKARMSLPDKSSPYAEAGTIAHELCEIKLKLYFGQITPAEFDSRFEEIKRKELYAPDMLSNSDTYLEQVKELSISNYSYPPVVYVEKQVTYDDICGSDGFGTSDCIMVGEGTLTVVDYKNGQGVSVSAYKNSQMMLYAYGALHSVVVPGLYDIKRIVMCIVQPNLGEPSVWETTIEELLDWVEKTVKPAVARIQSGDLSRVPGKHCKDGFCPNYTQCAAWIEKFASVYADYETDYDKISCDDLSSDQLGDLYAKISELGPWIKKVEKKVESLLMKGEPVKGFKLVAGRSTRCFKDIDGAFKALVEHANVSMDMLYERKPLTITDIEKLVGKKQFDEICKPYIGKSEGKPTIASMDDRRKELKRSAAEDFADVASTDLQNEPTNKQT